MRNLALLALALGASPAAPPRTVSCAFKYKTLIIMRGLPGSGKSSIAQSLIGGDCQLAEANGFRYIVGPQGLICTTDAYFYSEWSEEGNYEFDFTKIKEHHDTNQKAVQHAMDTNTPCIIVDNTHVQQWEADIYARLAEENGYKIVVVEVPHVSVDLCDQRNSHGVPVEVLENMEANWETFRLVGNDGEKL
jgi:predicted kinase